MADLWQTFDIVQKLLFTMAVPATALLLIELIMQLIGMTHGPDADAPDMDEANAEIDADDADMDADSMDTDSMDTDSMDASEHAAGSLRWFTLTGILAFFAVSGWAGLALIDAELTEGLALFMALGLGVLVMYLCALVLRSFTRMNESGTLIIENAVGRFAEAYLPIEPNAAAGGKVALTLQGQFVVLDAITKDEEIIPTGARVVITGVVEGSTLIVRAVRS